MLSDEWLSRYGLLENFNASVTRTRTGTGTGTGTWTTGVTAIALCTSCSRAKNDQELYHKDSAMKIINKQNGYNNQITRYSQVLGLVCLYTIFPILTETPLIFPMPWALAPFPKMVVRALKAVYSFGLPHSFIIY